MSNIEKNEWCSDHISEFAPRDKQLKERVIGESNFAIGKRQWKRVTKITDTILGLLLDELIHESSRFEGLNIQGYRRQGSSREGLKVDAADEFDTILKFVIKGLELRLMNVDDKNPIPGHCMIEVLNSEEDIRAKYPTLLREEVFSFEGKKCFLHSKELNERVFESMLDKACSRVQMKLPSCTRLNVKTTRIVHPPSVNITLNIEQKTSVSGRRCRKSTVAVDIVPGLLLDKGVKSDMSPEVWRDGCQRFALFKWLNVNSTEASELEIENPQMIWKLYWQNTKQDIMDKVSRRRDQRCVLTALRILKAYMKRHPGKEKDVNKNSLFPLRFNSFHLKTVALYCILFLTIRSKSTRRISSVREALGYFLDFLGLCLQKKRLPHFFYGNQHLGEIFEEHGGSEDELKLNLLRSIPQKSIRHCQTLITNFRQSYIGLYEQPKHRHVLKAFDCYISEGVYYERRNK